MPTVLVDHLAKIPLLVEQPHADYGYAQVAGRLELITGHIAKSSRIDRKNFAQHKFHAEIGNTGQGRLRVGFLKPGRGLRRLALGLDEVIDLFSEAGID